MHTIKILAPVVLNGQDIPAFSTIEVSGEVLASLRAANVRFEDVRTPMVVQK